MPRHSSYTFRRPAVIVTAILALTFVLAHLFVHQRLDAAQRIELALTSLEGQVDRLDWLYRGTGQRNADLTHMIQEARSTIRSAKAVIAVRTQRYRFLNSLAGVASALGGALLLVLLLWRLKGAERRGDRLERERRELEERDRQILEAADALRAKDRLHRLVTENSADIVALYDLNGRTTYVSPAIGAILGYSPEEYATATLVDLVHPADLAAVRAARHRGLGGEQVRIAFRLKRKGGAYAWFETISRPVYEEGRLVGTVASSRDITERKVFEEQMEFLAFHDHLTCLLNRAAFTSEVADRLAGDQERRVAVVVIDLDKFKTINESLGQQAGDEMLVGFAERLSHAAGPEAIVARLGGDQFALLFETESHDPEIITRMSESLAASLDGPMRVHGHEVAVSMRIGLAIGRPGEAEAEDLIRQANVAVRWAKRIGSLPVVYAPSMSENAVERLELDADLRRAIREGELALHFQPIVSLADGLITGAEALVRWKHPRKGWIPPSLFVPIAEQGGYVDQLGRWVLEEACLHAAGWLEQKEVDHSFTVSVNLSALQFQRPHLAEEIALILTHTRLPAERLTLELTESLLMDDPATARRTLVRLKALGIRIAIDDFGTGHSSLAYLKEFPLDILKIDRSFVSGLGQNLVDQALAGTVVSLARALGLVATAEGVESAEQLAELRELGCDKGQGYYFARPMPPEELLTMLRNRFAPGF